MRTDDLTEDDIRIAVERGNIMFTNNGNEMIKKIFSKRGILTTFSNPKKAKKYLIGRLSKRRIR